METSPIRKFISFIIIVLLKFNTAEAHDYWNDSAPVPSWVKSSCCGRADVHHLRPDQVHRYDDYYLVDGYKKQIPARQALPSQDGDYWIFYHEDNPEVQSGVYCFFVPMDF